MKTLITAVLLATAPATAPAAVWAGPTDAAVETAQGQTVSVSVLGAVCDFCVLAMNKTFGKRPEVASTAMDLDTKTLSVTFKPGQSLSDAQIRDLVKKAGYKVSEIKRG